MSISKRDVVWVIMCTICWVMSLAFAVFMFVGCADGCEPESMRCYGARVEVCNSSESWELSADCSEIEDFGLDIDWACCVDPSDGMHACLPYDECEMGEDAGVEGGM